jgi:hypothetical protein
MSINLEIAGQDEADPAGEAPALPGQTSEAIAPAGAVAKAERTEELRAAMARAKMAIQPEVSAAAVIAEFGGHSDVAPLAVQLEIGMNDLRGCEAMLYSQAHALHAIFVEASLQARTQEWFANAEALMRMAFKSRTSAVRPWRRWRRSRTRPCCSRGRPTSRKARSR